MSGSRTPRSSSRAVGSVLVLPCATPLRLRAALPRPEAYSLPWDSSTTRSLTAPPALPESVDLDTSKGHPVKTNDQGTDQLTTLARRWPRRRRGIATIGQAHKSACPATGKTRYRDRAQARDALDSCRWQRDWELTAFSSTARNESRIYRCPELGCNGGFHLTSLSEWREEAA